MPLNTLRLNHQASSHPNDRIVFIKPLPRPDSQKSEHDIADIFLRALAAQCLPIMKKHWLSVTTLEEYEPNREFMGRNFNNGECVQLVLRSKSGGWLPFNMVQMVMMHELAHNEHMNHGKLFWKTRNGFAEELRELWGKGYTGEGFWGSGRMLSGMSSAMGNNVLRGEELGDLPLCGGTYRTRRRKRKAKGDGQELSWKEKRDRRIEKKFGKNGVSLGEDEDKRMFLELGKGPIGAKPRVAQSKRGRELRAAAALARFDINKKEVELLKEQEVKEEETENDGYEEEDGGEDAKDLDGRRLQDKDGHGMTRVCDDDDVDDVHVKREMQELERLQRFFPTLRDRDGEKHSERLSDDESNHADPQANAEQKALYDIPQHPHSPSNASTETMEDEDDSNEPAPTPTKRYKSGEDQHSAEVNGSACTTSHTRPSSTISCPICSLENSLYQPTCSACAHVLDMRKDPKHWRCQSEACVGTAYINSGDTGMCGLCGQRKP